MAKAKVEEGAGAAVFLGQHHHALDGKNRVTVPKKLIEAIPDAEQRKQFVITPGYDEGSLFMFTEHEFWAMAGKFENPSSGDVDAAVTHAGTLAGVTHVNLSVSESAPGAQRLYESAGFAVWGTEPDAMCVDGRLLAERHLVRVLPTG